MKSVFTIVTSRSETRDISEVYKINPVEVLGSGQFGTVYGGHSIETNEQVAIKVIDKTRFSDQEEKIHREVDILHEITHPGVIKLHAMFDTPGKVIDHKRISSRVNLGIFVVLFGDGKITFGYVRNDFKSTD
jgi:serine/threonine protein kinase